MNKKKIPTDETKKCIKQLVCPRDLGVTVKNATISAPKVDENGYLETVDLDFKVSFSQFENIINLLAIAEFILKSLLDLSEMHLGQPVICNSEIIEHQGEKILRVFGSEGFYKEICQDENSLIKEQKSI